MENSDKKIDLISNQIGDIKSMLEKYIDYSTECFSTIEDRVGEVEKQAQINKLELLDKLASKDKVLDHEVRIQTLESQIT